MAGGANFPDGPPWSGGAKKWHDRIFVLTRDADGRPATEWLEAGRLPRRTAYAAAVSTPGGVLMIGGEVDGEATADVLLLSWDPEAQTIRIDASPPPLPEPASYVGGGIIGSTVYVLGAGRSSGSDRLDKKFFWSLDLNEDESTEGWTAEAPPYPGSPRHKCVVAVQKLGDGRENFFAISGSNPRFLSDGSPDLANFKHYTDAHRYDPAANAWSPIADLPVIEDPRPGLGSPRFFGSRWPVVAASGVGVGQSHILVFSGSTGRFLTKTLEQRPAFPGLVLAYHTITDTWTVAGDMPTGVVTTGVARWGDRLAIPSGETRPGVRTNRVQAVAVEGFSANFGAWNYGVLTAYLAGMLAIGGYFATRMQSTDDFFRGGQRVPFWVAGLSIFATMLSSITFIALPAKAYATDWKYYLAQLTILPTAFIVVHLAIPFFRSIDATSAYEYLERRFGYGVRALASSQFVLYQLARMAIVMYLPALALAAITPLTVMQCVLVMGLLSIVYCTLGGVEAVVWTDAIQTVVLMGGLLLAIVVVIVNADGGLAGAVAAAHRDGKLHLADFDFSWGSWAATTAWVVFFGQFFATLYSYTADQAVVQRYVTTKDARDAQRAMWTTTWMGVLGSSLFFAMGTALYVFYEANPGDLDVGMRHDAVFPLFIATQLPFGVAGLVVAGIFAAAQSTISTSMNSTATAVVTDFLMPAGVCKTDRGYLILARLTTVLLGVVGTALACWLVTLGQTMAIDAFILVIGLFGGAVTGLFALGALTRRANALGGLLGALAGFGLVLWVMLDDSIMISRFLYAAIGTLSTLVVGYAASWLTPKPGRKRLAGLTIYDRSGVDPTPAPSNR